jgi:beta-glucosidase
MNMKNIGVSMSLRLSILICLVLFVSRSAFSQDQKMDSLISALMNKMTNEEKIGQLNFTTPPGGYFIGNNLNPTAEKYIAEGKLCATQNLVTLDKIRKIQEIAVTKSRLKIPLMFSLDVIHGYKTVFPIPLGLSCTWDMKLIEQSARVAAIECSADGINWTLTPMVDISRDPRWGRIAESGGEDPYLGGEISKAMIKGFQGDDLSLDNTILACVKHYGLYGAAEAGRDYNTVDMSKLRMYNEYFQPYKAAIEAGAGSVMTSFNEIDGIPASGNKWLMTEVLRNQWGFKGFVVSDYTAVKEMVDHGMGNNKQVSALALKAGTDMDMEGSDYLNTLKNSLEEGIVTQAEIDLACRRILEMKYKLGLFDDPFRYINPGRQRTEIYTKANREIAKKIAEQSFVLMKNNKQVLPLNPSNTIAIIGPLADNKFCMAGTWASSFDYKNAVTVLQGFKESNDRPKFLYAKGANIVDDTLLANKVYLNFDKEQSFPYKSSKQMIPAALAIAKKADVVLLALGEAAEMTGESSSRTDITLPDNQLELLKAIRSLGKPVVIVLFTGRPLDLTKVMDKTDALLNVWFAGSEAGYAITDVLYGKENPSGKLTTTFPRNVGQIPIYYNHKNTGRPLLNKEGRFEKYKSNYLDERNEPLFPFGFGLSYTTFQYFDISLSSISLTGNQILKASVVLSNTGKYDGAEVVQLYIRDMVGSITRPVKELKGFQKVFLKPGESKAVSFDITTEQLKFYNSDLKYDWEPGEFEIMIGTNSSEVKTGKVNWTK